MTKLDFQYDDASGDYIAEEIDSCWGYYGSDHDKSGLAEAALSALPDETPPLQLAA